MILPYLDYGDLITYTLPKKTLDIFLDRALKICYRPRNHIPAPILHISAYVELLHKRRPCQVYSFMYKQQINVNMLDLRKIYTHRRDTVLVKTHHPKCDKYNTNIFYSGAIVWNNLPVDIGNINAYVKFKTLQKKQMLL